MEHINDELNLHKEKSFMKNLKKDEILLLSCKINKINDKNKGQERNIAVSTNNIYSLDGTKIKRTISIQKIKGFILSENSGEFIIYVPTEYDYRYRIQPEKRLQLLKLIDEWHSKHQNNENLEVYCMPDESLEKYHRSDTDAKKGIKKLPNIVPIAFKKYLQESSGPIVRRATVEHHGPTLDHLKEENQRLNRSLSEFQSFRTEMDVLISKHENLKDTFLQKKKFENQLDAKLSLAESIRNLETQLSDIISKDPVAKAKKKHIKQEILELKNRKKEISKELKNMKHIKSSVKKYEFELELKKRSVINLENQLKMLGSMEPLMHQYESQIRDLDDQIKNLTNDLQQNENFNHEHQTKIQTLHDEIEEKTAQIKNLEVQNSHLLYSRTSKLEEGQRTLTEKNIKINELIAKNNKIDEDIKHNSNVIQSTINRLDYEINSLISLIDEKTKQSGPLANEVKSKETKLNQLRDNLANLESQESALKVQISKIDQETLECNKNFGEESNNLATQVSDIENELNAKRLELENLRNSNQSQIEKYSMEINKKRLEIDELTKEQSSLLAQSDQSNQEAITELKELDSKIEFLKNQKEEKLNNQHGQEAQMLDTKNKKQELILNLTNDINIMEANHRKTEMDLQIQLENLDKASKELDQKKIDQKEKHERRITELNSKIVEQENEMKMINCDISEDKIAFNIEERSLAEKIKAGSPIHQAKTHLVDINSMQSSPQAHFIESYPEKAPNIQSPMEESLIVGTKYLGEDHIKITKLNDQIAKIEKNKEEAQSSEIINLDTLVEKAKQLYNEYLKILIERKDKEFLEHKQKMEENFKNLSQQKGMIEKPINLIGPSGMDLANQKKIHSNDSSFRVENINNGCDAICCYIKCKGNENRRESDMKLSLTERLIDNKNQVRQQTKNQYFIRENKQNSYFKLLCK